MASPKHKKSKMRKRQRVGQLEKAILAATQPCPNCGGLKQVHRVCPNCGMYKGRKVLSVKAK
ncbi:MAG: 50S ribosomal protein L32 [Kiritimatiellia bacterium]